MTKFLEFTDMMSWLSYTSKYMRDATQRKEMFSITVRDRQGGVIAKWNYEGSGQVWEKRSNERLEQEPS